MLQPRNHIPLIGEDVDMQSAIFLRLVGAPVAAVSIVVTAVFALQVAQTSPLFIKSRVGLIGLQHILRVRMGNQVAAELLLISITYDDVYIVIPRYKTAVAQGTKYISTVDSARHANLFAHVLQINQHIEQPHLRSAEHRSIRIVVPTETFLRLSCVESFHHYLSFSHLLTTFHKMKIALRYDLQYANIV